MKTAGEMTRLHDTLRRRIMEDFVKNGEDHVLRVNIFFSISTLVKINFLWR